MSLPVTASEMRFWRELAEHFASLAPKVAVVETVDRKIGALIENPATAERLRDHFIQLLNLDRSEIGPRRR
jgi:hypothetical protein